LYRLTKETIFAPAGGIEKTISYGYDAVGNRLNKSDSVGGVTTYTYDDNDRLQTEEWRQNGVLVGSVEALEIKKGGLNGLSVRSTSTVPKGKTAVTFDPSKDSGPEALRHLDKPPTQEGKDRRADELVSGGVLVKEREDGQKRIFENKVSSISENLKTNLQATRKNLEAEKVKLKGEIDKTSDQEVKEKLNAVRDNIEEAIAILEDIITGAGGKLQLIVALEPGADASKDQIEVVNRLLEAGARKLRTEQKEQQTAITHAIQEIDDHGNFIKSR
jgi:YD repeat-containing protein